MTYRIQSKNPAGEWENGIGDGEIYDYDTVDDAYSDMEYMQIDDFDDPEIFRIVEV